jgi:hypothetical protein
MTYVWMHNEAKTSTVSVFRPLETVSVLKRQREDEPSLTTATAAQAAGLPGDASCPIATLGCCPWPSRSVTSRRLRANHPDKNLWRCNTSNRFQGSGVQRMYELITEPNGGRCVLGQKFV